MSDPPKWEGRTGFAKAIQAHLGHSSIKLTFDRCGHLSSEDLKDLAGRHTTYDAFLRGIELAVVSDASCVFAPMVGEHYDQVQSDALDYLSTFYNSEVLESNQLL